MPGEMSNEYNHFVWNRLYIKGRTHLKKEMYVRE
jgi:hypothetical protein